MDTRRIALYLARARFGLGLAVMVAPRPLGRAWIGEPASSRGAAVFARTTGAREAALGAGASIAIAEGRGGAGWVSMMALVDGVDAVVSLVTPGLSWRARIVGLIAGGSAVVQMQLARELAASEIVALGDMERT